MFRKILGTASAVALVAGGLGLVTANSAFAGKPTITAGAGSTVHCDITGSAKLKPSLKDNWIKADHSADTNNDVKNLPNTTYAPNAPEHVTVKAAGTCTGTVTDGINTASVTKVKVTLADEAAFPTSDPGTCVGLFVPGDPSIAVYTTVSTFTSPTAKVVATTVVHAQINDTFGVFGGTISGSFSGAGGDVTAQGAPDGTTLGLFVDENTDGPGTGPKSATSASPDSPNVCQAGLKIKPTSASLKAPKGFAKIGLVTGSTSDYDR